MWYSVSVALTAVGALVVVVVDARVVVVGATVVVGARTVVVVVAPVVAVARLAVVPEGAALVVAVVTDEDATVEEETPALVEVELDAGSVLVLVPAPAS